MALKLDCFWANFVLKLLELCFIIKILNIGSRNHFGTHTLKITTRVTNHFAHIYEHMLRNKFKCLGANAYI